MPSTKRHIFMFATAITMRRMVIAPIVQLAGALPLRQQRLVEAWAELHEEELKENWQLVQQGRSPRKIKGLA